MSNRHYNTQVTNQHNHPGSVHVPEQSKVDGRSLHNSDPAEGTAADKREDEKKKDGESKNK